MLDSVRPLAIYAHPDEMPRLDTPKIVDSWPNTLKLFTNVAIAVQKMSVD